MSTITQLANTGSLRERLGALRENLAVRYQQRALYTTTLAELDSLSDRELSDLGLHRTQLREVAREAAYGA